MSETFEQFSDRYWQAALMKKLLKDWDAAGYSWATILHMGAEPRRGGLSRFDVGKLVEGQESPKSSVPSEPQRTFFRSAEMPTAPTKSSLCANRSAATKMEGGTPPCTIARPPSLNFTIDDCFKAQMQRDRRKSKVQIGGNQEGCAIGGNEHV